MTGEGKGLVILVHSPILVLKFDTIPTLTGERGKDMNNMAAAIASCSALKCQWIKNTSTLCNFTSFHKVSLNSLQLYDLAKDGQFTLIPMTMCVQNIQGSKLNCECCCVSRLYYLHSGYLFYGKHEWILEYRLNLLITSKCLFTYKHNLNFFSKLDY